MNKIELALEVLDRARIIPLALTDKAVNIIEKELDREEASTIGLTEEESDQMNEELAEMRKDRVEHSEEWAKLRAGLSAEFVKDFDEMTIKITGGCNYETDPCFNDSHDEESEQILKSRATHGIKLSNEERAKLVKVLSAQCMKDLEKMHAQMNTLWQKEFDDDFEKGFPETEKDSFLDGLREEIAQENISKEEIKEAEESLDRLGKEATDDLSKKEKTKAIKRAALEADIVKFIAKTDKVSGPVKGYVFNKGMKADYIQYLADAAITVMSDLSGLSQKDVEQFLPSILVDFMEDSIKETKKTFKKTCTGNCSCKAESLADKHKDSRTVDLKKDINAFKDAAKRKPEITINDLVEKATKKKDVITTVVTEEGSLLFTTGVDLNLKENDRFYSGESTYEVINIFKKVTDCVFQSTVTVAEL